MWNLEAPLRKAHLQQSFKVCDAMMKERRVENAKWTTESGGPLVMLQIFCLELLDCSWKLIKLVRGS